MIDEPVGPPARRRARLRAGRAGLHVAAAAPSRHPPHRRSRRRYRRVRLEPMGVPARDRDRHNPLSTEQILSLSQRGRSLAAQLHRVPQPAGAAADSGRRRRRRRSTSCFSLVRADARCATYALARRVTRPPAGSVARGPGFAWSPALVARTHRTLQPGRGRAAAGVRSGASSEPSASRRMRDAALAGLCMAWAGILRRVLRRLLPDDRRPLRVVAAPARHAAQPLHAVPWLWLLDVLDRCWRPVSCSAWHSAAAAGLSCSAFRSACAASTRRCSCSPCWCSSRRAAVPSAAARSACQRSLDPRQVARSIAASPAPGRCRRCSTASA